ncbi:hypothetical protein PMIN03_001121 [Paraphaeosphaeria minitans]|uniref:Uncharacterized protein n=1 Tax=Paraphaeosphaeria minitans TaxID=565426 RepID=A0A9P6GUD2_9PLEO|nr:hypothetical protein PMIN01_01247 [Paraphaeosphaeria minitans]
MASGNIPVPPAPKLNLPLQHYFQPKAQTKAQEAPQANLKMETKRNPEEELHEIFDWAQTLDIKEDMPLRLLVATSAVARNEFIEKDDKNMTQFGTPQPGVSLALEHLVKYMVGVMKVKKRHYALAATTCTKDIDLLLVAYILGWNQYIHNLHNYWWAKFNNEPLSAMGFETVSAMDERIMIFSDRFGILNLFVRRFASDPMYEEWRAKLPNIEAAVHRHNAERVGHQKRTKEQRRQKKKEWKEAAMKEQFDENLRAARGGRPGGYGMGV